MLEVDSAQRVGLLSAYKHDNSTLSGNVGSCVGSVSNTASAAVSFTGAQCCSVDQALSGIAQAALTTIQTGIRKSSYSLTPINTAVPLSPAQQAQATAGQYIISRFMQAGIFVHAPLIS